MEQVGWEVGRKEDGGFAEMVSVLLKWTLGEIHKEMEKQGGREAKQPATSGGRGSTEAGGVGSSCGSHGDELRLRRLLKLLLVLLEQPMLRVHALNAVALAWCSVKEEKAGHWPDGTDVSAAGMAVAPGHGSPALSPCGLEDLWRCLLACLRAVHSLKARELCVRSLGHVMALLGRQALAGPSALLRASEGHGSAGGQPLSSCTAHPQLDASSQRLPSLAEPETSRGAGAGTGLSSGAVAAGAALSASQAHEVDPSASLPALLCSSEQWLAVLSASLAASQPVSLRRAAAAALVSCQLLQRTAELLRGVRRRGDQQGERGGDGSVDERMVPAVFQLWLLGLRALDDEDEGLREQLAGQLQRVLAQPLVAAGDSEDLTHGGDGGGGGGGGEGGGRQRQEQAGGSMIPAQPERVVEAVFAFVAEAFACHPVLLLQHLCAWMADHGFVSHRGFARPPWRAARWPAGGFTPPQQQQGEKEGDGGAAAGNSGSCQSSVRKLFDREADNHHEEPLLMVQLCALHVSRLTSSIAPSPVLSPSTALLAARDWQLHFARQLSLAAATAVRQQRQQWRQQVPWFGGVTFHQDAFVALARPLYGLWALRRVRPPSHAAGAAAPASEPRDAAGSDVSSLLLAASSTLQALPPNPLLSSLLLETLHSYGVATDLVSHGNCAFEPLFLLHMHSCDLFV